MPLSRRMLARATSLALAAGALPAVFVGRAAAPVPVAPPSESLPAEPALDPAWTPQVRCAAQELVAVPALPDEEAARRALGASAGEACLFAELPVTDEGAVAGVTWALGAAASPLAVRTISAGTAGPWEPLDVDDAEAAEGGHAAGSEAIVLAGAERIQVAALASSTALTLQLYAVPEPAAQAEASPVIEAQALAADSASRAQPPIRTREQWGAAPRVGTPDYGLVTGVLIHHTASGNGYSAASVPKILRSMQAYHMRGRGWSDIAYNVIVDRFGVAWEGRGGGLAAAVVGAHSYGITNQRTFGLSLLGDYNRTSPSSAMMNTAEQVIAWKFLLHDVDPGGTTTGTRGTLPTIAGHRDDRSTSCPGRYVYAQLGSIRADVRARMTAAGGRPAASAPAPAASAPAPKPAAPAAAAVPKVAVTGTLGPATVRALQAWLGVPVDGRLRASTIRALQSRAGARTTGVLDSQTTRAVQRMVGIRADGLWGRGTTAALQRFLNAR